MSMFLNKRTAILTALFLGAFFLRFSFISKGPFHCDALDLALCSQATLDTGRLHYEHGTGYPLTVIVGALFIFVCRLFGASDPVFCVNLMSAVTGAAGVLLFFFVAEKLFEGSAGVSFPAGREDSRGASSPSILFQEGTLEWNGRNSGFHKAMFAAVLLLFFSPHILISTFGKSLTLSICLCLAATICLLRFGQSEKPRDLVLSGIFLGLCAAARLSDGLFALPLSVLYFSLGRLSWPRIRAFGGFAALAFLTTVVFYLPFLLERGVAPLIYVLRAPQEAKFLGLFSFILPVSLRWLVYFFNWGGVGLALLGWGFMVIKRHARAAAFLGAWFLVLSFFYGNVSSAGPRYLVIAWLPLLAAQGFLLGSARGRLFIFSFLWVVLTSLAGLDRSLPALEFRHRYALQVDFGRWVASRTPSDALVLAIDEDIFIRTYAGRETLRPPITDDPLAMERFFDEQLDPLLKAGRPVYIISTCLYSYDEKRIFRNGLKRRYELDFVGRKLNEDWHHAFSRLDIFKEGLFRIRRRP